jgi:hypothetical protein
VNKDCREHITIPDGENQRTARQRLITTGMMWSVSTLQPGLPFPDVRLRVPRRQPIRKDGRTDRTSRASLVHHVAKEEEEEGGRERSRPVVGGLAD